MSLKKENLIFLIIFLGVLILFFFPSPEENLLIYFGVFGLIILLIILIIKFKK